MTIQLRLIIADTGRREWLQNAFLLDPGLTVVSDDPRVEGGPAADVFVVDLAYPEAGRSQFWSVIHALYPWARLMAVAAPPIDETALQAAVHAGAYYMVEWTDPGQRLCAVAKAAFDGYGYIPLGGVLVAMVALFDRLNGEDPGLHPGASRLAPEMHQIDEQQLLSLGPIEFRILAYLAQNAGRTVTTTELLENIWHSHPPTPASKNRLKTAIRRLRRKIEPDPSHPLHLLTAYGVGYYLSPYFRMESD